MVVTGKSKKNNGMNKSNVMKSKKRIKTISSTLKKSRPNLKLKKYKTINKRMKKRREKMIKKIGGFSQCKGKRDGVYGCRTCCAKYLTGNYNKCIHVCMKN